VETASINWAGWQEKQEEEKMIQNDNQIRQMAMQGMIQPFHNELVKEIDKDPLGLRSNKVISYGLSSYGYDLRLSPTEFKVFRHISDSGIGINPKQFNPDSLESVKLQSDEDGEFFVLPGHSYGLGVAVEYLDIPDDVTCLFIGKSTYARCGLIANLTPGESGWKGHLTLEFANVSSFPIRLYANEGIVQALFFKGEKCAVSYEDRQGKYQGQKEKITTAIV
jgi:dCTP deaminase